MGVHQSFYDRARLFKAVGRNLKKKFSLQDRETLNGALMPQRLIWEFRFSYFVGTKAEFWCKHRISDLQSFSNFLCVQRILKSTLCFPVFNGLTC
jgi:hypothetical protein